MQDQEFWSTAGFVGTFASDYHDDLDDEDEDEDEDEDGMGGAAGLRTGDEEFNDDEPVLEICEPLDGGEARVVTHASQRAFEAAEGLASVSAKAP